MRLSAARIMVVNRPSAALFRLAAPACALVVALWLFLLLVSPYVVTHAPPGGALFGAGGSVYLAGRVVCHQRAERSFHAWGAQLPVCARCIGIYAGALLGSLLAVWGSARRSAGPVSPPPAGAQRGHPPDWRVRLAIAALPTAGSVGLELAGIWAQSPRLRCVAAIPLGFTAAWFVGMHAAEVVARMFPGLSAAGTYSP